MQGVSGAGLQEINISKSHATVGLFQFAPFLEFDQADAHSEPWDGTTGPGFEKNVSQPAKKGKGDLCVTQLCTLVATENS